MANDIGDEYVVDATETRGTLGATSEGTSAMQDRWPHTYSPWAL